MRKIPALLLALILVVASCGNSDDSEASETTNVRSGATAGDSGDSSGSVDLAAPEEAPADGDPLGDGGGERSAVSDNSLQPIDTGRDIIFTAIVRVEVENLGEASQLALTRIEGLGGLLYGQETTTDGQPRTVLTFKVAPEDFQAALRALGDVGEIREQSISASDVTERIVDLESQIITSEASVERLRGFLSNATELNQIAQLERELLERETVLERLRGQLRTVQNQVALATITVTLTEIIPGPALVLTETAYVGHDGGTTCGGDQELAIDEGDPFTLCIEIENVGDTHLTAIEIRDDAFKLKTDDFTLIEGSLDGLTAPGDTVELYYEGKAVKNVDGRAQATARPVDQNGAALGASVSARSNLFITVDPDTSLPGISSGFESGWATVSLVVYSIILALAFLLPLLPLLVVAWFAVAWVRRWLGARPPKPVYVPPPPVIREPVASAPAPEPRP